VDLEVREVILAEELERGLHSFDGWDLLTELDQTHAPPDEITDEHAVEAMRLSQHIVGISNALAHLGMLSIQDIP
jgi:hypothetical protein